MEAPTRSDKRGDGRKRLRIPCEIQLDDRRLTGIVLDVSPTGLFIQTTVLSPPGTPVRVTLKETPSSAAFAFDAVVARGKRVPPQLAGVAGGGIGLRVLDPSPDFQKLSATFEGRPAAIPEAAAVPDGPIFRVRVARREGNRSRVLEVVASDDRSARQLALTQLGPGWDIQEVTKR